MTIDERIEKLTERHEALAQSVELLTHSIHEQGDNIDKLLAASAAQGQHIDKMVTLIENLANIARSHNNRIEKLEDGQS